MKRIQIQAASTAKYGFLAHMIHVVSKEWGGKSVGFSL